MERMTEFTDDMKYIIDLEEENKKLKEENEELKKENEELKKENEELQEYKSMYEGLC